MGLYKIIFCSRRNLWVIESPIGGLQFSQRLRGFSRPLRRRYVGHRHHRNQARPVPDGRPLRVVERYRLIDYEATKAALEEATKEWPQVGANVDRNYRGKGLQLDSRSKAGGFASVGFMFKRAVGCNNAPSVRLSTGVLTALRGTGQYRLPSDRCCA